VRAVSGLCEFYPDICLTTEEKARKNLSQGKINLSQVKKNLSQSTVYILPKQYTYYQNSIHITKTVYILPKQCTYYQNSIHITKTMMDGVSPETCWAIKKRWIINSTTRSHLVGYFYKIYITMHGSITHQIDSCSFEKYLIFIHVSVVNFSVLLWTARLRLRIFVYRMKDVCERFGKKQFWYLEVKIL